MPEERNLEARIGSTGGGSKVAEGNQLGKVENRCF